MVNVTLGKKVEVKPFPKLMKNSCGDIVYFLRPYYGVPLSGFDKKLWNPCDFEADIKWCMDGFTDYNEPVLIQNA